MSTRGTPFQVLEPAPRPIDERMLGRLIGAYQAQKWDAPSLQGSEGCWTDLGWIGNLGPLEEALAQGDIWRLQGIQQSLFQTDSHVKIQLYGEELGFSSSDRATFLPSWTLLAPDSEASALIQIGMIINQDTLADLDEQWAGPIMSRLCRLLGGPLISVGPDVCLSQPQMGHRRLRDRLQSLGLRRIDRVPFQVRPGYMREIYWPVANDCSLGP